MKVLGISTASKYTGVALIDQDKVIGDLTSLESRSEDLVVLARKIMDEAGIDVKQIEAVAVAQGPGSYSGLRGGLAGAKSLSQVLDVPLIGVSTLEAVAFNLLDSDGTIAVIMDAVRGELNFALFSCNSKNLKRITDDIVIKEGRLNEFLSKVKGELFVVTNVDAIKKSHQNARFADKLHSIPYAKNVARIGLLKLEAGEKDDHLSMVPKYSHMPAVKEFKGAKT